MIRIIANGWGKPGQLRVLVQHIAGAPRNGADCSDSEVEGVLSDLAVWQDSGAGHVTFGEGFRRKWPGLTGSFDDDFCRAVERHCTPDA